MSEKPQEQETYPDTALGPYQPAEAFFGNDPMVGSIYRPAKFYCLGDEDDDLGFEDPQPAQSKLVDEPRSGTKPAVGIHPD